MCIYIYIYTHTYGTLSDATAEASSDTGGEDFDEQADRGYDVIG